MDGVKRLWCWLFGHRWDMVADWRWRSEIFYWREVTMRCSRCAKAKDVRRFAFAPGAGALSCFEGKDYPYKDAQRG